MSAQNLLSKMDPMVRKLETELESFKDALSKNDLVSAQQHLKGIAQTSDFLAEDATSPGRGQLPRLQDALRVTFNPKNDRN